MVEREKLNLIARGDYFFGRWKKKRERGLKYNEYGTRGRRERTATKNIPP